MDIISNYAYTVIVNGFNCVRQTYGRQNYGTQNYRKWRPICKTGRNVPVIINLASYFGDPVFDSRHRDRLSQLRVFIVFFILFRKFLE
jgi:hypothetical protein